MELILTVYSCLALVLLLVVLIVDFILLIRFRKSFHAIGSSLVTYVIVNLVAVQVIASLIYGTTSAMILLTNGKHKYYIELSHATGTSWLMSSTLLHVIAITCIRIYSISYWNRFIKFSRSRFNVYLVLVKLWFVSLAVTFVTLTSGTSTTWLVFHLGLLLTGILTVMAFFFTRSSPSGQNQCETFTGLSHESNLRTRERDFNDKTSIPSTYTLFAGILILFAMFSFPILIPNVYFILIGQKVSQPVCLIVSLWSLAGIPLNSLWIVTRCRPLGGDLVESASRTLSELNETDNDELNRCIREGWKCEQIRSGTFAGNARNGSVRFARVEESL